MSELVRPRHGVVLVNLGTPDEPTPTAVRRFLREFLSDRRVVNIPRLIWLAILHLFILPFRPHHVAELYRSVWSEGDSPIRRILKEQSAALQQRLQNNHPDIELYVVPAMTYGNPSLASALDQLQQQGVEQVAVLPLYPQYSVTTTAPVYDAVQRWCATQTALPALSLMKDYYKHPLYLQALARKIQDFWQQDGQPTRLLFSFHGLPQAFIDNGDPYFDRCRETAMRVAAILGLESDAWAYAFQSRLGSQPWIKPYTDELLQTWGAQGISTVHTVCPGFSADCLETLEEMALRNRDVFLQAGGKHYEYIPALNADEDHIELMEALIEPTLRT